MTAGKSFSDDPNITIKIWTPQNRHDTTPIPPSSQVAKTVSPGVETSIFVNNISVNQKDRLPKNFSTAGTVSQVTFTSFRTAIITFETSGQATTALQTK
jgi:hypothetical protein